jgi:hypothetical protein
MEIIKISDEKIIIGIPQAETALYECIIPILMHSRKIRGK